MSKERLTEWYDGRVFCPQSIKCAPMCDSCEHMRKMIDKLAEYEDLEEQGLLIKLPTNVGETVYCLREGWDGWNIDKKKFEIRMIGNFGKTVFLTQSEAEEKLRELEGK